MLLGIAAAIAVAAVVIALVSGGGDSGGGSGTTQATATTTEATAPDAPEAGSTPVSPTPETPKPDPIRIRVEGGEPVGGTERVRVKKGERVEIDVVADAADEAHLHGYDIEKELEPGKTARFRFKADIEGVFELELHHSGAQLARVTVKP
jgi:FtsP/CotA-like multicopper oxidase with cupredoxin domain